MALPNNSQPVPGLRKRPRRRGRRRKGFNPNQPRDATGKWSKGGGGGGVEPKGAKPGVGLGKPRGRKREGLAAGRLVESGPLRPPPVKCNVIRDDTLDVLGNTDGTNIRLQSGAPPGTLHHEEGHAYDMRYLNEEDHKTFLRLIGRPKMKWWASKDKYPHMGAEFFADVYSQLKLLKHIYPRWEYSAGDQLVTGRQLIAVGRWLKRLRGRPEQHHPAPAPTPYIPPPVTYIPAREDGFGYGR